MRDKIHLEVLHLQHRRSGTLHGRTPQKSLHASDELRDGERLGKIVVRPGLQPQNPCIDIAPCGKNDDGKRPSHAPDVADDCKTILFGKHDVNHRRIVGTVGCCGKPRFPIGADRRTASRPRERSSNKFSGLSIVFYYKNVHAAYFTKILASFRNDYQMLMLQQ